MHMPVARLKYLVGTSGLRLKTNYSCCGAHLQLLVHVPLHVQGKPQVHLGPVGIEHIVEDDNASICSNLNTFEETKEIKSTYQ
jgi:hypothetical protein